MSIDIWAPMSAPGARPSIVESSCKRVYVATLALESLFVCPSLAALWLTVAVCGIMWLCGVSWRPAPGAVWPLLASSGDSLPSPSRLHASPWRLGARWRVALVMASGSPSRQWRLALVLSSGTPIAPVAARAGSGKWYPLPPVEARAGAGHLLSHCASGGPRCPW